jgi:hypothetical protein
MVSIAPSPQRLAASLISEFAAQLAGQLIQVLLNALRHL